MPKYIEIDGVFGVDEESHSEIREYWGMGCGLPNGAEAEVTIGEWQEIMRERFDIEYSALIHALQVGRKRKLSKNQRLLITFGW